MAGEVRQLVDAFLPDHGGIHVGEEQILAPAFVGLHHDVNGSLPIAARTRPVNGGCRFPEPLNGMSAAMPGSSQIGVPGRAARRGAGQLSLSSAGFGRKMSVATCSWRIQP